MPREIADSDDELDFVPPAKLTRTNVIEHVATTCDTYNEDQLDPVLGTDFDQFLSPTQRLSSYDGNHDSVNDISTSRFLDSSTNRFLEAIAPSSHSPSQNKAYASTASQSTDSDMGGKRSKEKASTTDSSDRKRPRSQMEDGDNIAQEGQATKKRAKATYGSTSTSSIKSKDVSDFEAMMHDNRDNEADDPQNEDNLNNDADGQPEMVSVDERTDYTSPLDLSLHLSPPNNMPMTDEQKLRSGDMAAAGGYAPPQPYQPRGDFYGANLRGVTTSNSSMGNYQSFSINPEKLGMDFDKINPFGSLSQVSLPGDLDSEETRGIANIFRNSASYSTKASAKDSGSSRNMAFDIEHDMQTSPIKGENEFNLRSRGPHTEEENEAQCSPPFSQITNPDEQNMGQSFGTSRRRADQVPAPTVDEAAAKPAPKKRGRKPKNAKKIDIPEPLPDDVDELQADEQVLDRRRRAGTIDSVSNMSEVSQATNSSQRGKKRKLKKSEMAPPDLQSKKLPSSDLGLDHKAIIGLSPERYVPRPSRRRGQVEPQIMEPSEFDDGMADEPVAPADEDSTKASPAKGKKGKKGKKKGAKATASAMAKQREDLNADDTKVDTEEAVSTEQSSTNITSQAQLNGEGDEIPEADKVGAEEDEDNDEAVTRGGDRRTKISVDIPVLTKPDETEDLPPPVAEPKKRGRKRKKPHEEAIVEPSEDVKSRTPLYEKDANIQIEKSEPEKSLGVNSDQQENQDSKPSDQVKETEENDQIPAHKTKTTAAATNITPLKPLSTQSSSMKPLSSTPLFNARARIGLSKRHSIPPLLRKVDRNKEAPKNIERKEKVTKRVLEEREQERIAREEAETEGREYKPLDQLRDKDGRLVEWDF